MLEEKDLQAIGTLLDQKLKENNQSLKTEIFGEMDKRFGEVNKELGSINDRFDEVLNMVNDGFSGLQVQVDEIKNDVSELKVEVAKRPTRDEVFNWADDRFIDLELAKDRHDFLHIDELDKLPAPIEISKALIERGFKHRQTMKTQ